MFENSLKTRFENVCERLAEEKGANDRQHDEIRKELGYVDNSYLTAHCRVDILDRPALTVHERLSAIEELLGIEIVREPSRIVARKKAR